MTMIKEFLKFHTKHNTCEYFLSRFLKLNDNDSDHGLSILSLALIANSNKNIEDIDLENDFFETDINGLYDYHGIDKHDMNVTDIINMYKNKAEKYGFIFEILKNNSFLIENH